MADVGQRIVLGVEVDQTAARATSGLEGGVEPECVSGDCEALFLEKIADCIVCFVLLVCSFGVGPDLALSVPTFVAVWVQHNTFLLRARRDAFAASRASSTDALTCSMIGLRIAMVLVWMVAPGKSGQWLYMSGRNSSALSAFPATLETVGSDIGTLILLVQSMTTA